MTALPQSRLAARADGTSKYYKGTECPRCHNTTRYTRSGSCCHCDRKRSNRSRRKSKWGLKAVVAAAQKAGRFRENVDRLQSFYSTNPLGSRLSDSAISEIYDGREYEDITLKKRVGP